MVPGKYAVELEGDESRSRNAFESVDGNSMIAISWRNVIAWQSVKKSASLMMAASVGDGRIACKFCPEPVYGDAVDTEMAQEVIPGQLKLLLGDV